MNNQIFDITQVKKVGVIYSEVKREYFPTEEQYVTEKDALDDAKIIAEELRKLNLEVYLYPGDDTLMPSIKKDNPQMVFNLVDSVQGNEYLSSAIPGMLEMLDVPYTGAGLLGLALCYNKFVTKKLLRNSGIPVPNFQLINAPSDSLDIELRYPLFSKLNEIHGAVEINKDAVSENEKHLRERLAFLIKTYNQPVLVEEYIAGREITALVLQGSNTKVYMAEKKFNKPNEKYVFATFEDQWINNPEDRSQWAYTYEKYEENNLKDFVKKAFEVTKMDDYAKFDIRLDSSGRYYFIDANANPAFGPKVLNTSMGLIIQDLHGVPFTEILKRLIFNTIALPRVDF